MVEVTQADIDRRNAIYRELTGAALPHDIALQADWMDKHIAAHRIATLSPSVITPEVVEAAAIAMWRQEAERAMPNVAKNRTAEAWSDESQETRLRWLGLATAAIPAALAMLRGEG